MNLYHLYPKSPFSRFRTSHDGLDVTDGMIHSDTLFSALVNVHDTAYGQQATDEWVQAFKEDDIRISSVFVGLQSADQSIYFLPKPTMLFKHELQPKTRKDTKAMQWVSKGLLQEMLTLFDPEKGYSEYDLDKKSHVQSPDGKFWCLPTEATTLPDVISKQVKPGLAIDRVTGGAVEGMLYNQADWLLPEEINGWKPFLYVLTEGDQQRLATCLRLLADTGIGGKRSTGAGQLSHVATADTWDWSIATDKGLAYQLSLFNTVQEEEMDQLKYYEILVRGGHHASDKHQQMQHVNMVAEGAITLGSTKGRLVELCKQPPVFRYGKSLSLKF